MARHHLFNEAYENPFMVTPGGQAVGTHDRPSHTRLRGAALAEREAQVARGATSLEREGIRLHIKQVGNEYRIFDHRGNDTQKFAHSLDKARAILEKMVASQR